jgi:hypothetical protein
MTVYTEILNKRVLLRPRLWVKVYNLMFPSLELRAGEGDDIVWPAPASRNAWNVREAAQRMPKAEVAR